MKNKISIMLFIFAVGTIFIVSKNHFHLQGTQNELFILNWSYTPNDIKIKEPVQFHFKMKNKKAMPIENAVVNVDVQKNGKSFFTTPAGEEGNGVYKTTITFPEAGNWTLLINIKKENGDVLQKELHVFTANRIRQ